MGFKIVKMAFLIAIIMFVMALIHKAVYPNDYEYPVTRLFKTIEDLY